MKKQIVIFMLLASCMKIILSEKYNPYDYLVKSYIQHLNISSECKASLLWYRNGIKSFDFYATKMLDSCGKPEPGLFSGRVTSFGDYDQCLDIKLKANNTIIAGKYCLVGMNATNLLYELPDYVFSDNEIRRNFIHIKENRDYVAGLAVPQVGVCMPSQCSVEDLQQLLPHKDALASADVCYTKEQVTNRVYLPGTIGTLCFFSLLVSMVLICTICDLIDDNYNLNVKYPGFVKALSINNNIRKIFGTEQQSELSCVSGIVSISMMFIVFGHVFFVFIATPLMNPFKIIDFNNHWASTFVKELHLHVEAFFAVGGLLAVYTYLEAKRRGIYFNIPLYYIHRILRIYPVLIVCVLISKNLSRYLGDGPMWGIYEHSYLACCDTEWWIPLTSMSNLIWNYDNVRHCMMETWYLTIDVQMRILSPLILIPLGKRPKITIIVLCVLVIFGAMIQMVVVLKNDLSVFGWIYIGTEESKRYSRTYYHPLYTRYPSYLIGMIGGYFLHRHNYTENKIKIPWLASIILWAILAISAFLCMGIGNEIYLHRNVSASAWMCLKRPIWASIIMGLIILCTVKPKGPVNQFLSCGLFKVLSRLTLGIYLIHFTVATANSLTDRTPDDFSFKNMFRNWCRVYIQAVLIALMFALFAESPVIYLEKRLFGRFVKKISKEEHEDMSVAVSTKL